MVFTFLSEYPSALHSPLGSDATVSRWKPAYYVLPLSDLTTVSEVSYTYYYKCARCRIKSGDSATTQAHRRVKNNLPRSPSERLKSGIANEISTAFDLIEQSFETVSG